MPREIRTKEEFQALQESASEIRVSKQGDSAKLKLRTDKALYTFKTSTEEADTLVKGVKIPVVEFD